MRGIYAGQRVWVGRASRVEINVVSADKWDARQSDAGRMGRRVDGSMLRLICPATSKNKADSVWRGMKIS